MIFPFSITHEPAIPTLCPPFTVIKPSHIWFLYAYIEFSQSLSNICNISDCDTTYSSNISWSLNFNIICLPTRILISCNLSQIIGFCLNIFDKFSYKEFGKYLKISSGFFICNSFLFYILYASFYVYILFFRLNYNWWLMWKINYGFLVF